jgi:hypothetical protein
MHIEFLHELILPLPLPLPLPHEERRSAKIRSRNEKHELDLRLRSLSDDSEGDSGASEVALLIGDVGLVMVTVRSNGDCEDDRRENLAC